MLIPKLGAVGSREAKQKGGAKKARNEAALLAISQDRGGKF